MSDNNTPQAPAKTRSLIINLFFYIAGMVVHYLLSAKYGKALHRKKIKRATDLLDTVPSSGDNFFTSLKKSGLLFEKLAYTEQATYDSYREAKESLLATDPTLVCHQDRNYLQTLLDLVTTNSLFESTEVVGRIGNGDDTKMVVTRYDFSGGRALYTFRYFYAYGDYTESEFITNFDCYSLFGDLFTKYNQAAIVSYSQKENKTLVEPLRHELFCKEQEGTEDSQINNHGKAQLDKLLQELRVYSRANEQRTYLLVGQPGTGKTTTCLRLAKEISPDAIIKLDFSLFLSTTNDFLYSLVKFSKAKVIIIDDIDRTMVNVDLMQKLLYTLESVKGLETKPVLLATANTVATMPKALLRPGRFDRIVEFLPPSVEERIEWFSKHNLTEEQLKELVLQTEGLSHSHLKEIEKQFKCGFDASDVINDIKLRKKYEALATGV